MTPIPQIITTMVLTFNFWGLPDLGFRVLSPLRQERSAELCERLKASSKLSDGWDVILLQEVWLDEDREMLGHCGYVFVADENDKSLPLDSGLMILSRYPLDRIERYTFPMQADVERVAEDGESLARKSALMARVHHPKIGEYWVANTHLVSDYSAEDHGVDRYRELRRQQFSTFLAWARKVSHNSSLIVGGDWNIGPGNPLWKEVEKELGEAREAPGADKACTLCPPNTMHTKNEGKVDHLFAVYGCSATKGGIALTLPLRVSNFKISLSDHWGWETSFSFIAP